MLGDALVKIISDDVNIWQLFFYRGLVALPIILMMLKSSRQSLSLNFGIYVHLRSIFFMLAGCIFLGALSVLDFALAAVIFFLAPIFTSLLSAVFLKIPVSAWQWLSLGIGFLGVIISINPMGAEFHIMIILPLIAALFYAVSMVLTHQYCSDIAPLRLVYLLQFYYFGFAIFMLFTLSQWQFSESWVNANPFLFGQAREIDFKTVAVIAMQALFTIAAFWGISQAYQSKSPQIIALFEYSYLIFAPIIGLAIFHEPINLLQIFGIALIIIAGFLALKTQTMD